MLLPLVVGVMGPGRAQKGANTLNRLRASELQVVQRRAVWVYIHPAVVCMCKIIFLTLRPTPDSEVLLLCAPTVNRSGPHVDPLHHGRDTHG